MVNLVPAFRGNGGFVGIVRESGTPRPSLNLVGIIIVIDIFHNSRYIRVGESRDAEAGETFGQAA